MLKKDKIYIASHSGLFSGNLVRNTIPSFVAAYKQGADILEADITQSADGELYLFHDGFEKPLLHTEKAFRAMTSAEISQLDCYNIWNHKTGIVPNRLDDFLEEFKGKCLLNLDRCWDIWTDVVSVIRRHRMEEQIILKSPPKPEHLEFIAGPGNEIMYMPIIRNIEETELLTNDLNIAALEIIFKSKDSPLVSLENISRFHKKGILLWVNAIVYNCKKVLSGGYTDDIAMTESAEKGWGPLIDMGFDIIQTDFPGHLMWFIEKYQKQQAI